MLLSLKYDFQQKRQLLVDHILNHQADFYRLAFSYVKNQDAAMDVVQEAIVKALDKVDTLREPAYLKTWFYRILLNEAMNHFRRTRDLIPFDEALNDRPAVTLDPGERLDLYDAIERLSFPEQTVVKLRFFEDMKLEEIARATGANLNTVKSRLYKALKKLKSMTGEEIDHAS
ncbi:MAG TPA: sigma-70 family RNA polymerase sigma factor [Candidatus Intestinimonas pullistercoris]|uniref:Sigma-70 family RNA polymerase sigma factor n=1 Tax=Candidatus Intestinimonas pullistercoris TaxID=2838623 RepID=A0A9D2P0N5_9FIRM|nr:sigma-70 family RNA polymerase sigma factor [Candidatus Intestinimonas pullistercoris]